VLSGGTLSCHQLNPQAEANVDSSKDNDMKKNVLWITLKNLTLSLQVSDLWS
jgi:hypothetical protein